MKRTRRSGWRPSLVGIILFFACAAIGYFAAEAYESRQLWDKDTTLKSLSPLAVDWPDRDVTASAAQVTAELQSAIQLHPVDETGLHFAYTNGQTGLFHLAETLGGGGAAIDLDADGNTDLVFADGGDPIAPLAKTANRVLAHRQIERGKFAALPEAGINWHGYSHGCSVADYNNDGFSDLLVTGYGSAAMFLNLGDGTFDRVTESCGVQCSQWAATAAFGDLDQDGDLDLYITGYADVEATAMTPVCNVDGVRIQCHPHYYESIPDMVFENLGDGTFADRSTEWGIDRESEFGMGVVIANLMGDFYPEIFIANDGDRNLLLARTESGTFEDVGISVGAAYNNEGQSSGSMGIALADFDNNGRSDLLTTNFNRERNVLLHNMDDGLFLDQSAGRPMDAVSRGLVGWAAVPLDLDFDFDKDLVVANGHVTQMPDQDFRQRPILLENQDSTLVPISGGTYFGEKWHGRGSFAADLVGDHRLDIVMCHIDDPPTILENKSQPSRRFLSVRLVGTSNSRDAFNATVTVAVTGHADQVTHTSQSAGYLCTHSRTLQFATGLQDSIAVTVVWPNGQTQIWTDVSAGSTVILIEGRPNHCKLQ